MSAGKLGKRPAAAAALAVPPQKRLRGKQEAPGYNQRLPKQFLTWRAQHIYTAYKNLGGSQLMKKLVESLAVAEPNPTRYAELMSIYVAECLAAEGQPPVACLGLLVEEWGVELTVTEWKLQWEEAAAARKKPTARKKPAGKRGKTHFCQGFAGDLCRFSTKEAGQPSRTTGGRNCLLCSEALLRRSQADPGRRGVLTRILKALRAQEESPDIFETACARLDLWLKAEEAAELRAKAATAKRARPKQTRAAAQEERLSAARGSFNLATAKRQTAGPAPTHAAWRAYRAKSSDGARRSSTPTRQGGREQGRRRLLQGRKWTTLPTCRRPVTPTSPSPCRNGVCEGRGACAPTATSCRRGP